ncbi:hypothetical protein CcaverHIS002_0110130 [Cutaneotrichosporon cavernicola]|uniref:Uncharacterized protein n=1 Tax=Cutaneotrichosporon cavernicola TaxID=279322 RepID=A0AA48I2C0_9TREE|nr:uncharacterized protein CcaverHIS019_0110070 [Cutaneotrichosporon cavernicola]BEI80484.1 hypothetical protein CcaverHIS002_0110130 [Cutaneotrichosporon cavernicola]BEI88289.1 hypothetical protein CcaverHIS019_0110070 [Cutaneotrichosporon cavernicola]BEI96061.1 hypothetical protein CcaverHIS631_0110100 [Cutaneotrichosporon cavernicola]BEJ03833.1 hypothetical protein CcaverHIS641_0110080 [Cutaneotrichosporon cavernicola]
MGNILSRTPEIIHPSNEEIYHLCGIQFFGLSGFDRAPLCASRWITARPCKLQDLADYPSGRRHCPRCNKVFLMKGTPAWEDNRAQNYPKYEGPWFGTEKDKNGGIVAVNLEVSIRYS